MYLHPGMHLLLILAQIAIPAPRGYVNDFAGVLDPAAVRRRGFAYDGVGRS